MNWTKDHRHQPTSSEQTLAQRREHPHIWAAWLPRLLTGENSCEWAIWFKAHHQDWTKVPSDFNQAQWILNHTALLNKRKAEWELSHYNVAIEGQNSFQLRGRSATLAGKPDLITQRDGQAVIVDVKTGQGQPRPRRRGDDLPVRYPESAGTVPEPEQLSYVTTNPGSTTALMETSPRFAKTLIPKAYISCLFP